MSEALGRSHLVVKERFVFNFKLFGSDWGIFVTKLYFGSSLWENILIRDFYPDKTILLKRSECSECVSVMTMKVQTPHSEPYRIQEGQSLSLTTKKANLLRNVPEMKWLVNPPKISLCGGSKCGRHIVFLIQNRLTHLLKNKLKFFLNYEILKGDQAWIYQPVKRSFSRFRLVPARPPHAAPLPVF